MFSNFPKICSVLFLGLLICFTTKVPASNPSSKPVNCKKNLDCPNKQVCHKKVCIKAPDGLASINKGFGCKENLQCKGSLVCLNGKCLQVKNFSQGLYKSCKKQIQCKTGLFCRHTEYGDKNRPLDNLCMNPDNSVPLGQKCFLDPECKNKLACVNGTCAKDTFKEHMAVCKPGPQRQCGKFLACSKSSYYKLAKKGYRCYYDGYSIIGENQKYHQYKNKCTKKGKCRFIKTTHYAGLS